MYDNVSCIVENYEYLSVRRIRGVLCLTTPNYIIQDMYKIIRTTDSLCMCECTMQGMLRGYANGVILQNKYVSHLRNITLAGCKVVSINLWYTYYDMYFPAFLVCVVYATT